jgi:hypothetical protein
MKPHRTDVYNTAVSHKKVVVNRGQIGKTAANRGFIEIFFRGQYFTDIFVKTSSFGVKFF